MTDFKNTPELSETTEPAISYNMCYAQPFLLFNESNLDTMKRMPDNFVDLVVTSPPYDNLRDYKGYSFPFEDIAKELYRVTKQGGAIVWIVNDKKEKGTKTLTSFKQALFFKEIGFFVHDIMIWEKCTFSSPIANMYHNVFEYMFILSKGKPKTFNPIIDKPNKKAGTKTTTTFREANGTTTSRSMKTVNDFGKRYNIWKINEVKNNKEGNHPAPFPEQLANDHIISWSNENDLIYDPFAGSGTTGKMAILNKRKCIMSEISVEYCEIIKKRLEPIINERTLF